MRIGVAHHVELIAVDRCLLFVASYFLRRPS